MNDRKLPQAIESEKLVLGSIMSRSAYNDVSEILTIDCFYLDFHKMIYNAIKSIVSRGDFPDFITVINELKLNGQSKAYEITLISQCITDDPIQHALIIYEKSMLRNLIRIGQKIVDKSYSESDDLAEIIANANEELSNVYTNSENNILEIKDAIDLMIKNVEANTNEDKKFTGSATGFDEFDKRSGGFQKSDLIIIAAESSQGKTSLALSMTKNMALNGDRIAIYSLEMGSIQIAARITSMESGIPANEILYSKFDTALFEKLDRSIGRICNTEIYIDERSTSNIETIITSIRKMAAKFNIKGVVVDYIQLINVNERISPEQKAASISRRLKNLAKELGIWVIVLSQLNRDSLNPVPNVNRLRDSGQINEAADITMFIYRPEYYDRKHIEEFEHIDVRGTAMIDVAKGRNIGVFKFIVNFDKETTHFTQRNESITFQKKQKEVDYNRDPFA